MPDPRIERTDAAQAGFDAAIVDIDWDIPSDEDEVLVCGVENPEVCESCQ